MSDPDKLDQETIAARMNISRRTFGRVLALARTLVSGALIPGKMIRTQRGDYALQGIDGRRGGNRGDI